MNTLNNFFWNRGGLLYRIWFKQYYYENEDGTEMAHIVPRITDFIKKLNKTSCNTSKL